MEEERSVGYGFRVDTQDKTLKCLSKILLKFALSCAIRSQ